VDLTDPDEAELDHERARVAQKLRLRPRVTDRVGQGPAATSTGAARGALARRPRRYRIPTPELNSSSPSWSRAPAAGKQGKRLRLLYIAQIGERPPRFSIQVNNRQKVTRDYAYFLENRLRERYALEGIPVIIDFAERKQRRRAA
jgi:GTP-binding protein